MTPWWLHCHTVCDYEETQILRETGCCRNKAENAQEWMGDLLPVPGLSALGAWLLLQNLISLFLEMSNQLYLDEVL